MTRVVYAILVNRSVIEKFYPVFEVMGVTEVGRDSIIVINPVLGRHNHSFIVADAIYDHYVLEIGIAASKYTLRSDFVLRAKRVRVCLKIGSIVGAAFCWRFYRRETFFEIDTLFSIPDCHMLLTIASVQRRTFYSIFVAMMFCTAFERLVATLYWSWYEKQGASTVVVLIAAFVISQSFASSIAQSFTFREDTRDQAVFNYRYTLFSICLTVFIVGFAQYFALLYYNKRELNKLRLRGSKMGLEYSLNRMYQLRENVAVMEMILRLTFPLAVLFTPAILFYMTFMVLPKTAEYEYIRSIGITMFDCWYGLMVVVSALASPFADKRFKKAAYEADVTQVCPKQRADLYFNWLNTDLNNAR